MSLVIYYVETMPPEVCAAAMMSLCQNVVCIADTTKSASLRTSFCPDEKIKTVILLGTYWNAELCERELQARNGTVHVFRDHGKMSPVRFVENFHLNSYDNKTNKTEYECSNHGMWASRTATVFHQRHLQQGSLDESQNLLNGLYHHDKTRVFDTLFEKFRLHFSGAVTYKELIDLGKAVTTYQKSVAEEQALKNSTEFRTKSGHVAVACPVANSVNVTHEALFKTFPHVDLTIVAKFDFKNNELALSLRSRVAALSAVDLIRALPLESPQHGDGNSVAAGGRIPLTLKLSELF